MQMYRKPRRSAIDRHILIELNGDYTDYELKHLLRKAYENHKAPHEYDDLKKYIKDIIIGEHNSQYVQKDGQPNALASAAILLSPYINSMSSITNDYIYFYASTCTFDYYFQSSCGSISQTIPPYARIGGYNNGNAILWYAFYTSVPFSSSPSLSTQALMVGNGAASCSGINAVNTSATYALYESSTSPFTLTTYLQWTYPSTKSAASYSYVYFMLFLNYGFVPLFYSTGTYSFSPGTQYITEWQFTYS